MKTLITLGLVASLGMLAGCASSGRSFHAVGATGDLVPEAEYLLESDTGVEGSIRLRVRGKYHREIEGRLTDILRVRIAASNESGDPIEIPLPAIKARDDAGHDLRLASTHLPEDQVGAESLVVAPKSRTSFDLVFDAGGDDSLRTIGSVTLEWIYRFRGTEQKHRSRFLPVRYTYRRAYPASIGIGFGYWGGPCW